MYAGTVVFNYDFDRSYGLILQVLKTLLDNMVVASTHTLLHSYMKSYSYTSRNDHCQRLYFVTALMSPNITEIFLIRDTSLRHFVIEMEGLSVRITTRRISYVFL